MAVIGQSHLSLESRVPDYSYHSYTIVRIVPTFLYFKTTPHISFSSQGKTRINPGRATSVSTCLYIRRVCIVLVCKSCLKTFGIKNYMINFSVAERTIVCLCLEIMLITYLPATSYMVNCKDGLSLPWKSGYNQNIHTQYYKR